MSSDMPSHKSFQVDGAYRVDHMTIINHCTVECYQLAELPAMLALGK